MKNSSFLHFIFSISKFFGLITLLLNTSAFAQNTNGVAPNPKGYPVTVIDSSQQSLAGYKDRVFGALDLSPAQIPSGRLMEYSLLGWDKTKFTRTSGTDSINSPKKWFELYHRLHLSQVNTQSNLLSADSIQSIVADLGFGGDTLPVLVLDKSYQTIRQSALAEGCFTIDTDGFRLYDVAGRSTNPYATERLFAVSLYKTEFMAGKRISFSFPQSLWLGDAPSIRIDLGDGQGWRTATPQTVFHTIYDSTGEKYIRIAKSANGTGGRTESFNVQVIKIAVVPGAFAEILDRNDFIIGATPDYDWFLQSNYAYQGERTSLHARVYMGCGNVLDRPVFILEGFDPDKTVDTDGLFRVFSRNIPRNEYLRSLYTQGYDLIFVDWRNGNSPIEANALLLETLIEYTNSRCATLRQPSTVIGLSMGGLIARYCLRDMENKGKQHQVGDYISYDSPHQGAMISAGLQFVIKEFQEYDYIGWFDDDFKELIKSSNSPAAQQMIVWLYGGSISRFGISNPTILDNQAFRNEFAAKLERLGYPQVP